MALGEVEIAGAGNDPIVQQLQAMQGAPVAITDKGYDWIRARDAAGEAEQDRNAARGTD